MLEIVYVYCISNENWTKLMRYCQIQCNFGGIDELCKLGKEYWTALKCKIMHFILDKVLKLLTYYTPFCHQSLQSYRISKTVRFLAHPVVTDDISRCCEPQQTTPVGPVDCENLRPKTFIIVWKFCGDRKMDVNNWNNWIWTKISRNIADRMLILNASEMISLLVKYFC